MSGNRPEAARVRLLRRLLGERRIGPLLVTQRENVRYLTGFTGSAGSVIVAGERPVLITDFRYQEQAGRESAGCRIVIQTKDHLTALSETAQRYNIDKLWIDESSMTMERIRVLRKKGLRVQCVPDPVAEIRRRKDAAELQAIRRAIRRAEDSFRAVRRYIRQGVSERELALKLEWSIRSDGARRTAFDTIVASGRNGSMPHATVTGRRLRSGDLVTIDFGAEADGYYCDLTRTVCVGSPNARQREIHTLVLRAQEAAISTIAPGVACRDVDRAARSIIEAAGFGQRFGHATGHGIGLLVHEGPALSGLAKDRLEPGMVVTVEPGIYLPGWGGVRIEDMVVVTEKAGKVLTTLDRYL